MDKILWDIKDKPTNYLEKVSLEALIAYLGGYEFGGRVHLYPGYLEYLQKKYNITLTYGIEKIVLLESRLSDEIGFNTFYDELENYNNTNPEKYKDMNVGIENLYDLLNKMKLRPGMYMGNSKLFRLYHLIKGFEEGMYQCENKKNGFNEKFQMWVERKYNVIVGKAWYRIINFYSEIEEDAIKNFYELLNEFLIQTTGKTLEENAHLV
ncbi:hypothetical protein [Listeria seeligeri]|uniref:hypothetical protein n=1 Tax=Listeria seeligeri TaxID=1640 RepID=UPI0031CCBACD